jgi:hypothetical protein
MPSLKQIPKQILTDAFEAAMRQMPFDTLIHRLMLAMELRWYNCPDDARTVARNQFEYIMEKISEFAPTNLDKSSMWVSSGCIKVEIVCYNSNVQCHITFDPATASGMGMIYTNE